MVLTAHGNAAPDLEVLAARQACHGDHEPCTASCTACIVCGRDAGRADLLCGSCRATSDG